MRKHVLLFVCTGNCCRSQMAEAIARHVAGRQFDVHSCGAAPAGFVHPLALAALDALGVSAEGLESKSWDVYLDKPIDIAISVCEDAAAICPVFPGDGVKVAWPMPDPSFTPGTDEERLEFAIRVASRLKLKIERLAALDLHSIGPDELRKELDHLSDI